MKKIILVLLFLILFKPDYSGEICKNGISAVNVEVKNPAKTVYSLKFNQTVEFIKKHEGFRNNVYLDINGYPTIGYGFLTKYVPFKKYITKKQADSVVVAKMKKNVKLAEKTYPHLNKYQHLAVAHLIYAKGLGRILNHPIHKQLKNNSIKKTTWIYFSGYEVKRSHYRKTRKFEYELYNL